MRGTLQKVVSIYISCNAQNFVDVQYLRELDMDFIAGLWKTIRNFDLERDMTAEMLKKVYFYLYIFLHA